MTPQEYLHMKTLRLENSFRRRQAQQTEYDSPRNLLSTTYSPL